MRTEIENKLAEERLRMSQEIESKDKAAKEAAL